MTSPPDGKFLVLQNPLAGMPHPFSLLGLDVRQDVSGVRHPHLLEAFSEITRRSALVCWKSFRLPAALEHLGGVSGHAFDLGVDELERGIIRSIKLIELEMVCTERDLVVAVNAGAGLWYNLATR